MAPTNAAAEVLVETVVDMLLAHEERSWEAPTQRRGTVQAQLEQAVGAIVGNLLVAWSSTRPCPFRVACIAPASPASRSGTGPSSGLSAI